MNRAESDGLPPLPLKGARGKKQPRWVMPFLRALVRTGEVRQAAEDAGIDHTTAYVRRRTHADFASLWRGALAAHEQWKKLKEDEEIAAVRLGPAPSPGSPSASGRRPVCPQHTGTAATSPPEGGRGEERIASAGQVRRVGHGRWSRAKEAVFFEELAATANATLAAKAAGVSTNAVFARRLKHPVFRAKWEAVVRTSKASIDLYLVEEAKKTFDPEALDTGEVAPRVSIDQAIKISQLNASKAKAEELPDPFAEEAASMTPDDVAELRKKLVRKLRRMRDRDMPDMIAKGWSYDEEHDHMVPPGWTR